MDLGTDDEDDSHVRWLMRVDGHIATAQPGPYGGWWDGYLVDATLPAGLDLDAIIARAVPKVG
jgi:hypothetical protein